jgi:hypothetical protein
MTMKLRLVALAAASLLLFACGGGGSDEQPAGKGAANIERPQGVNAVLAAVAQAEEVTTVHFKMTMKLDGGEDIGEMEFEGKGATDNANGRGWFEISMMGIDIETIIDGDTMYMRSPIFAMLGAGSDFDDDTWGKISIGEDLGELGSMANTGDYRSFLANLRGASEAEEIGREKVDGKQTTHYRVQVNLDEALKQASEKMPQSMRDTMEAQAELLGDEPMTMDVWVRDDGLIARVEQTMDLMGMGMTTRIDFFDYGKAVKITLPDPDKVKDLGDFEDLLSGAGVTE